MFQSHAEDDIWLAPAGRQDFETRRADILADRATEHHGDEAGLVLALPEGDERLSIVSPNEWQRRVTAGYPQGATRVPLNEEDFTRLSIGVFAKKSSPMRGLGRRRS